MYKGKGSYTYRKRIVYVDKYKQTDIIICWIDFAEIWFQPYLWELCPPGNDVKGQAVIYSKPTFMF